MDKENRNIWVGIVASTVGILVTLALIYFLPKHARADTVIPTGLHEVSSTSGVPYVTKYYDYDNGVVCYTFYSFTGGSGISCVYIVPVEQVSQSKSAPSATPSTSVTPTLSSQQQKFTLPK